MKPMCVYTNPGLRTREEPRTGPSGLGGRAGLHVPNWRAHPWEVSPRVRVIRTTKGV